MPKEKKVPEHPPFPKIFAQQRTSWLARDFREAAELENTNFFHYSARKFKPRILNSGFHIYY